MPGTGETGRRNDLSGTVYGPAVQAGAVHGDVHLHGARDRPPVPGQLLTPIAHFVNRRSELARLDEALADDGCLIAVLSGPGGVGKTALAMRWAHAVRDRFPDGQLYVDLGGFGGQKPVDPAEALGGFLRALGAARRHIPVTVAEQAALFRSYAAGRALLVILDNAYSAAQVRVLLPASAVGMVLVTSRSRLIGLMPDGARLVEVPPLPAGDSLTLLARAIGAERVAREPRRVEDVAAMCGGLPIALSVAAARLAARPLLTVARIAAELADEAIRLTALSTSEGVSVQAVFDVSYRSLEPAAAAMYRKLSLHPGPEFGAGPVAAIRPLARAPAGAGPARAVEPLLEASMLQEVEEDRFRFHDLLRLHARQKAENEESPDDRRLVVLSILEWYMAAADRVGAVITPYRRRLPYDATTDPDALPAPAGREEALGWLERERVNLLAAAATALDTGHTQLAWQLSDVLWPLFLYRKHYRDRLEMDQLGVAAARRWGNAWAEAHMLKRLGMVCAAIGDHHNAELHTSAAIRLAAEVGDVRGGLEAQESLALLYRNTGREHEAAELLTRVLAASRELGEPRRIGLSLISLGRLLPGLGRLGEAVALLREARSVFAELSGVDPYNGVQVTIGLAGAYLYVGDLDRAERAATEAARRMLELGSPHGHAEALDLLGRVAERRGDAGTADGHYRSALRIFDGQGSARAADVRRRLADLSPPPADPQREAS
jgi:tetratricopeptide (TPR) repeat protein